MALREIHTLNNDYLVYAEFHDTELEAPDPVDIRPLGLLDGGFTFVGGRYGEYGISARPTDVITISFERI